MEAEPFCCFLALLCFSVVWATRSLRAPSRTPLAFELLASGAATIPFAFVLSLVLMRVLLEAKLPLSGLPSVHDSPFASVFGGAYLLTLFVVLATRLREGGWLAGNGGGGPPPHTTQPGAPLRRAGPFIR
jgi:hypothetical protein